MKFDMKKIRNRLSLELNRYAKPGSLRIMRERGYVVSAYWIDSCGSQHWNMYEYDSTGLLLACSRSVC